MMGMVMVVRVIILNKRRRRVSFLIVGQALVHLMLISAEYFEDEAENDESN